MNSTVLTSILFLLTISLFKIESRLQPVKFMNNGIYALENQHTGKYLTAGKNGEYLRTGDQGKTSVNQRWKFMLSKDYQGQVGWQLVPQNGETPNPTLWKQIYVEHGKFQFKSISSGKCLESSSDIEGSCDRENHAQRWYPYDLSSV